MLDINSAGQKANKNITNQVKISLEQIKFREVGGRKIRKEGKKTMTIRVWVKEKQSADQTELHKFLEKPGQPWSCSDF